MSEQSLPRESVSRLRVELVGIEAQLLQEIADRHMTRDDVAYTYAFGLVSSEPIAWARINHAIMDRWSRNALSYIKTKAWKIAEANAR